MVAALVEDPPAPAGRAENDLFGARGMSKVIIGSVGFLVVEYP